jgi:acyl-CoA thioester hydrolase
MTFRWQSPVFFDELDLNGTLHNARYAVHVERAQSALFESLGKAWAAFDARHEDLHYAVRELHVEFFAAFRAPGLLPIELTGRHLGTTSARYDFHCGDETVSYARGHRVIVKVDPDTGRPKPWTPWYRTVFEELT